MTIEHLHQVCSQNPGKEVRCCFNEHCMVPLLFGFIHQAEVLHSPDEVFRMKAIKPACYVRDGIYQWYYTRTWSTDELSLQLGGLSPDARVEVCYEDPNGLYRCHELHSLMVLQSMVVLFLPTRQRFLQAFGDKH